MIKRALFGSVGMLLIKREITTDKTDRHSIGFGWVWDRKEIVVSIGSRGGEKG